MPGRDLSAELYGTQPAPAAVAPASTAGRDLSAELYGAPQPSMMDSIKQGATNLGAGLVRGAGSIGATLLWPIDKAQDMIAGDRDPGITGLVTGKQPLSRNEERRQAIDSGLSYLVGSDPNSLLYKAGKLGGEVAGTAGVGGVLANGARAAGMSPELVASLASGGMRTGGTTGLASAGVRAVGGGAAGLAAGGMINPADALGGGLVGAVLPGFLKGMGAAGNMVGQASNNTARSLMQSALKPTIKQLQTGDAATAVDTLLKYGITPNQAGVERLQGMIGDLNNQVAGKIANSSAVIDKNSVLNRLDPVRQMFSSQVSPTSDLNAIQGVADDFMGHPNYPGATMPVQDAQAMKQGTYQVLAKKYGQIGSADTEAQKGLARGLKEEIANAVPEVAGLNAAESKMITTLKVTERRALMELNKNPMGLASLAKNPLGWAAFMADKSATFKALAARMVNGTGGAAGYAAPALESGFSNPLLRAGALDSVSSSEQ